LGSVEFICDCGEVSFLNSTDNRAYLAHLIPDQEFDAFSAVVDDAIEKSGPEARDKGAACMAWRSFPIPRIWQCYACGSIYVEAEDGNRHRFLPASDAAPKHLFKRK
jgi:hypothetical protein